MQLNKLIFILAGCHPSKPAIPKADPPQEILDQYATASDRLIAMSDGNYVVSRHDDDTMEHIGDSLIWTGIALGMLPCTKGDAIEASLFDMIDQLDGGMWRHPSLPDQISLDGAIGVYRGAAKRIMQCPGSKERWSVALAKHLQLGKLNPKSDQTWPLEFKYVPELALAVSSGSSLPSHDRLVALTGQINDWALATVISHSACYRLNLGYQTFRTIEELGQNINNGDFCAQTAGAGLATIDRWCGRNDGHEFISNFEYDRWEFQPQRCSWEGDPDGKPGLHTPGLDLIEMIYESYNVN